MRLDNVEESHRRGHFGVNVELDHLPLGRKFPMHESHARKHHRMKFGVIDHEIENHRQFFQHTDLAIGKRDLVSGDLIRALALGGAFDGGFHTQQTRVGILAQIFAWRSRQRCGFHGRRCLIKGPAMSFTDSKTHAMKVQLDVCESHVEPRTFVVVQRF